ncbi:uncharacterized protein TNCV_2653031 [Trichonephila clavipes]|nr:uncharacterized protein TNCV_2653031 [Trichonephila clavipes]
MGREKKRATRRTRFVEIDLGLKSRPLEDASIQDRSVIQKEISGATAHEGQGLLCPFQYTGPIGAEVHEQMSQSGGQSEARPPVFKSPSKLGFLLSTHCSREERLCPPCPAQE